MPTKSYKMNNKSELQAKGDSVVLTNYKKVDDGVSVAEIKETQENKNLEQENESEDSNCFSALRKKQKSLNLIINSFKEKFQRFTTENSKLAEEINFLKDEIETLVTKQKEWDQNIEKIIMVIEQQRERRTRHESKVAMETKIKLKHPEIESESDYDDERFI